MQAVIWTGTLQTMFSNMILQINYKQSSGNNYILYNAILYSGKRLFQQITVRVVMTVHNMFISGTVYVKNNFFNWETKRTWNWILRVLNTCQKIKPETALAD